jgi:hypothetical protein
VGRWQATSGRVFARAFAPVCALGVSLGLAACVEAANDAAANGAAAPTLAHRQIERREGVSLASAAVAIVSGQGAPEAVTASFLQDLASEAKAREIVVVEPRKARYLVRGYLSATVTADGATLEYVWDVFGPDKQRAQRLNDVISVKGAGDDAWAIADEAALTSVAAKSADDLAAFLSNTADAKPIPAVARASEPAAAATAMGYTAIQ